MYIFLVTLPDESFSFLYLFKYINYDCREHSFIVSVLPSLVDCGLCLLAQLLGKQLLLLQQTQEKNTIDSVCVSLTHADDS
jgi:hypothetical protein